MTSTSPRQARDFPGILQQDLAWAYDYPATAVTAIAGMVAFYNEAVDLVLDGRPLTRPVTHFVD